MNITDSNGLFKRACRVVPGGVNSPVRSFKAVGGTPLYIKAGCGSKIYSTDGKEFIDFCNSWGSLILGHAHPVVVEAIKKVVSRGTSFGTCTEAEVEMAELLCSLVPYIERVRLVNSGTEACMTAIRLARAYTSRNRIIKFDGCYHGHVDSLLVSAGSGLANTTVATSAGVPSDVIASTIVVPYNDIEAFKTAMRTYGEEIAGIIVEPISANMGLVLPVDNFLQQIRELADINKSVLIFDEVITGFRLAPTTYGVISGIKPDLTCLGKIIGGGLPVGAVGGKAKIMDMLAPVGPVYQAGTFSGNPVALSAGIATIKLLTEQNPYSSIVRLGIIVEEALKDFSLKYNVPLRIIQLGGMFTIFFTSHQVTNFVEAKKSNTKLYASFFHKMLEKGFYLVPSQFETCFISASHSENDIELFIRAVEAVLFELDNYAVS